MIVEEILLWLPILRQYLGIIGIYIASKSPFEQSIKTYWDLSLACYVCNWDGIDRESISAVCNLKCIIIRMFKLWRTMNGSFVLADSMQLDLR